MPKTLFVLVTLFVAALSGCGVVPVSTDLIVQESQDIGDLESDSFGYLTVKTGQKISFPVIEASQSEANYKFSEHFEIVGILGDPEEKNLTDFEEGEVWFVLRSFRADFPQFFILVGHELGMPKRDSLYVTESEPPPYPVGLAELRKLFNEGFFVDERGKAKTTESGYYMYILRSRDYSRSLTHSDVLRSRVNLNVYPDLLENQAFFTVGVEAKGSPINANVFGNDESGRLMVTVNAGYGQYLDDGSTDMLGSSRIFLHRYKFAFVAENDVKNRPDISSSLPDTSNIWLEQKDKIDWEKYEEPPKE